MLSGYLISRGLYVSWINSGKLYIKNFYVKRTLRIFPGYYFFITISFLLYSFIFHQYKSNPSKVEFQNQTIPESFSNFWGDFVFLGNYFQGLNTHTWSLSIEEQFYLILPAMCGLVLFRLNKLNRIYFLLVLYFICLLVRILTFTNADNLDIDLFFRIYYQFQTRYDSLLAGVLVMFISEDYKEIIDRITKSKLFTNLLIIFAVSIITFCMFRNMRLPNFFNHTFLYSILNIGFSI